MEGKTELKMRVKDIPDKRRDELIGMCPSALLLREAPYDQGCHGKITGERERKLDQVSDCMQKEGESEHTHEYNQGPTPCKASATADQRSSRIDDKQDAHLDLVNAGGSSSDDSSRDRHCKVAQPIIFVSSGVKGTRDFYIQ